MYSLQTKLTPQRFAAAAAMGALFTYAVVLTLPQASVNEIAREFNVSDATLSALFRLLMLGFFCAAIGGGWVSDRLGKLPVVAIGCVLMSAGMLLFQQGGTFASLKVAAILAGMGGGLAEVVATAMISDLYYGPKRTSMMNWSQVIFSAGAFLQPLLFAKMLGMGIGWRYGYAVVAGLAVVAALAAAGASVKGRSLRHANAHGTVSWRVILKSRTVLRMSVALLLYIGAELGLVSWVAVYLERDLKASPEMAAAAVAVFWIGIGVGRFVATLLAGRLSDDTMIRLSFALGALFISVLLLMKSPSAALIMVFLAGVPQGPAWPTIVSRAGYAFPGQTGSVLGVVASAGCLGGVFLPTVIGRLSDEYGIRMALWTCVAALILGLTIFGTREKPVQAIDE